MKIRHLEIAFCSFKICLTWDYVHIWMRGHGKANSKKDLASNGISEIMDN